MRSLKISPREQPSFTNTSNRSMSTLIIFKSARSNDCDTESASNEMMKTGTLTYSCLQWAPFESVPKVRPPSCINNWGFKAYKTWILNVHVVNVPV